VKSNVTDKLRIWPWLCLALAFTAIVAVVAPYQLGVLAWSLSKLSLGAYLGYWVDRSIFHYCRPHAFLEHRSAVQPDAFAASMIRRALIIAASILALGLGV
jgi:hypothetical protein|tara:strand:- start:399 stop:701 length:303 start_codon:yes stop_codon:yes gene_type:complete